MHRTLIQYNTHRFELILFSIFLLLWFHCVFDVSYTLQAVGILSRIFNLRIPLSLHSNVLLLEEEYQSIAKGFIDIFIRGRGVFVLSTQRRKECSQSIYL